jgi:alpha-glucan, water dikinase
VAVATWLRLSAMRLLTWNRNYNIKPREIATAQNALAQRLASVADSMCAPPLERCHRRLPRS